MNGSKGLHIFMAFNMNCQIVLQKAHNLYYYQIYTKVCISLPSPLWERDLTHFEIFSNLMGEKCQIPVALVCI